MPIKSREQLIAKEKVRADEDEIVFRIVDLMGLGHFCRRMPSSDRLVCERCERVFDMRSPVVEADRCPLSIVEHVSES